MSKIFLLFATVVYLFASTELTEHLNKQKVGDEALYYPKELSVIYKEHSSSLLWNNPSRQKKLLKLFTQSKSHGLAPSMFHYKKLLELITQKDHHSQLKLDLLLSDALLHYINIINYGVLDPHTFYDIWNLEPNKDDISLIFTGALKLQGNHFEQYLNNLYPQHFIYSNTHKALKRYLSLQKKIQKYPKVNWTETLRLHSKNPVVAELAQRLFLEGDLKEEYNATLFDKRLEDAVKHYQERHGLKRDGIVGKITASFFKTTIQEQIDKLSINLERARWVLHNLEDEYIIVNISSYRLYYVKDKVLQFTTKVIVGKKMYETPIFSAKMRFIVYNPTWIVPHSIAIKELLPKVQTIENYLDTYHLELLDQNYKLIDHHKVDFKRFNEHNFPYIFRQKPGDDNALGRIKFLFPNKEAIYLHDTPAKALFRKDNREFSHGCIRVHNPFRLSERILRNSGMWSEKIKALEVQEGDEIVTTTLTLKHTIDVLLMYWSAAADREGNAYFYEDHYHLDPPLIQKLKAVQSPQG